MEALLDSQIGLTEDGRKYLLEDQHYDRVTDILHGVLPPYLVPWAEGTGIEGAWKALKENPDMDLAQTQEMVKARGWDCESQKDAGGSRGAEIHFALESWIKQGMPPTLEDFEPEHRPYAQSLCQFLVDYRPEFECSELTVWHPELGYAGTIDAIGRATTQPKGVRHPDITGKRFAWDVKTNQAKRVYFQHMFQLAAYRLGLDYHGVEVDGEAVIAIGPSPWKNSGRPYSVVVNYVEARHWVPIVEAFRALEAAKLANPNSRSKA